MLVIADPSANIVWSRWGVSRCAVFHVLPVSGQVLLVVDVALAVCKFVRVALVLLDELPPFQLLVRYDLLLELSLVVLVLPRGRWPFLALGSVLWSRSGPCLFFGPGAVAFAFIS